MSTTTPAVVIGAGIAGAATAYYLTAKGLKGVLVLERDTVASGATGSSGAEVFMHHTNQYRVLLSWHSLHIFRSWNDLTGEDSSFRQTGSLYIVSQEEAELMAQHVRMARSLGVDSRLVGAEGVKLLQPFFRVDDLGAGAYDPDAGHGDGSDAANAFLRRARQMGARLMQGTPVASIEARDGKVTGVNTATGEFISSPIVVVAAGAWSAKIARTAGVEVPIVGRRIAAGLVVRLPEFKEHMTVYDRGVGTYWRMEATTNKTLLGIAGGREGVDEADPDSYSQDVTHESTVRSIKRLVYRWPAMADAYWQRTWAAVDGYTPDRQPLLGVVPEVQGLYLAAGFSGYGFMQGPAAGLCLAELILDGRAQTVDIRGLRPSRFADGQPIAPPNDYVWPHGPWVLDRVEQAPESYHHGWTRRAAAGDPGCREPRRLGG